jgi:Protein ENHANCED DISEASE RESISTANCE 2, C-terminal
MQLASPSGRLAPSIDRWEDPPGEQFLVRGADYMKTKKKVPSAPPIYRCADDCVVF